MDREHFAVQAAITGFDEYLDKPYLNVWDKREKILEVLAENNLRPEETLFIGDMQHDIEAARRGAVHSCAVLTGYNTLAQLREARPDRIVENLQELREYLERAGLEFKPEDRSPGDDALPVATVGAVIFDSSGRALMVRTHKWSDLWGIPGGKIKRGETCSEALRRELKEETNLDIEGIEFVMVQDCIDSTEFYRKAHFVLLNYTCRCAEPATVRLNDEAREFRWVGVEDALKMRLNQPTRKLLLAVAALSATEAAGIRP